MIDVLPISAHSGTPSSSTSRGRRKRIGLLSTFPPSRCGIASYSASLIDSLQQRSPLLDVDVVRLVSAGSPIAPDGRSSLVIDPNTRVGRRAAARRLNRSEVVIIQHEYGIYGHDDGEGIIEILDHVRRPAIAVLHTVLDAPSERQRAIINALDRRCSLVVLSESAREILARRYGIAARRTTVIPHGATVVTAPPNRPPRRRLITWGLLGPGKGLERAIGAMPLLADLDPHPLYQIVGRTHPVVLERSGFAYRRSLERLVGELGVQDMVRFVDRYVDDLELVEMVSAADVVVVPYDNSEQVSSGVITEAVALGRPVVATRFPYARELLDPGPGITVDHDSGALAGAVRSLLVDQHRYTAAARAATERAPRLSWRHAAEKFAEVIGSLIAEPIPA